MTRARPLVEYEYELPSGLVKQIGLELPTHATQIVSAIQLEAEARLNKQQAYGDVDVWAQNSAHYFLNLGSSLVDFFVPAFNSVEAVMQAHDAGASLDYFCQSDILGGTHMVPHPVINLIGLEDPDTLTLDAEADLADPNYVAILFSLVRDERVDFYRLGGGRGIFVAAHEGRNYLDVLTRGGISPHRVSDINAIELTTNGDLSADYRVGPECAADYHEHMATRNL